MSTAQRIQLPDGSTVNLPGGGAKEWQLFQTLTLDIQTTSYEWDGLDFTEFFFDCTGVKNGHKSTDSVVEVYTNDERTTNIQSFHTLSTNAQDNYRQQVHIKYNGLFWEEVRMVNSSSDTSMYYAYQYSSPQRTYLKHTGVGVCENLKIKTGSGVYIATGGTIKIYAR